jgi:hypothetical protein
MGRVTRRQLISLLGPAALVATLAGLAFGLPAIDRSLPSERPIRPDKPYEVGGGVTVLPPAGATLDLTGTRPGDERGMVLFRLGPVSYSISVQPFTGTLANAADRLRHRITGTPGYQVTGSQLTVDTTDGISGLQGGYTAPGRGGRYTVFVTAGRTIEVTVSGAELDLGSSLPAIEASTRTLAVDQAGAPR